MAQTDDHRWLPLREVALGRGAERRYDRWIAALDEELSDPTTDRNEFCRRVLGDIYLPGGVMVDEDAAPGEMTLPARVLLDHLDPRRVTLEPEYYAETDIELYGRVKPLIWLWEMFDKSLLGENVHLGVKFRRMLAKRVFGSCGRNFKAFSYVRITFGYGLEVGDDVVVHRHVLLDDRGGIRIGDRASISDFANVYSHSHDVADAQMVRTPPTVIGDGVRIAYHATVLAGVRLAPGSMLGAGSLATRDTEAGLVYAGAPAKAVKKKPGGARAPHAPDPLSDERAYGVRAGPRARSSIPSSKTETGRTRGRERSAETP